MLNKLTKRIYLFSVILFFIFSLYSSDLLAYSYGTAGKDTMVVVYENVMKYIENDNFEMIKEELKKLDVPFKNIRAYFNIDMEIQINTALKEQDSDKIRKSIEIMLYYVIRQHFHWNIKEKIMKYISARARLKVIINIYTKLIPTVNKFDNDNKTGINKKIKSNLFMLTKTLGNPGVFGYKAIQPSVDKFIEYSHEIEELLIKPFPHFKGLYEAKFVGTDTPEELN